MYIKTMTLDVDLLQGSYTEIPLVILSYDDNGNKIDTDITGVTISCKFRKSSVAPVVLSMDTTNHIEVVDAAKGQFKIKVPASLTASITERNGTVYKGHVEAVISGNTYRTHEIYAYYSPEINY